MCRNLTLGEREPHSPRSPLPIAACACLRGRSSIYSALFLAPSSEEPDSQLMTGTHRVCHAVQCTRQEQMCGGSRLLHLQMPFLPWEVGCLTGLASYFLKTLLWQGGGLLLISGAVNATFLIQDPIPRHCEHSLDRWRGPGRLGWEL